ncbi:CoA-transferase family III domain-containing protein [Phakopsora pachyrhizi]|uniref:CoA-transferase family III domain-containing protein n=1 Tax=Phakopsora pachyrhizi TaxID=170000 RepID=A0AAV0BTE7_PHAPC|nr:CoA-transferase family III domain-containing protein [Phakopsora pachyrhizi]
MNSLWKAIDKRFIANCIRSESSVTKYQVFSLLSSRSFHSKHSLIDEGKVGLSSGSGCLSGIKVIDLSRVLAGPSAAQLLGDLGADVIKIEEPKRGDDTRYFRTKNERKKFQNLNNGDESNDQSNLSNYFISCNRNKRSLTLNLKTMEGIEIFKTLIKSSDVLIENFKSGKMEELGIGYQTLKEINPKLIYSSITGFGNTGPLATEPGYDVVAAAKSGLMSITGERDRSPVRNGVALCDIITGLHSTIGIISALYQRDKSFTTTIRSGQSVDVSLFESSLSVLFNIGCSYLNSQEDGQRWGTQHPSIVPYQAFETKNGYVIISATNDQQFQKLCDALGLGSLKTDPRFKTNDDRVTNRIELIKILSDQIKKPELINRIKSFGLPCTRVNSIKEGFDEPQAIARGMIVEIDKKAVNGTNKRIKMIGTPIKLSKNPIKFTNKTNNDNDDSNNSNKDFTLPPPTLGEHTNSILKDQLGYSESKIKELKKSGVI